MVFFVCQARPAEHEPKEEDGSMTNETSSLTANQSTQHLVKRIQHVVEEAEGTVNVSVEAVASLFKAQHCLVFRVKTFDFDLCMMDAMQSLKNELTSAS